MLFKELKLSGKWNGKRVNYFQPSKDVVCVACQRKLKPGNHHVHHVLPVQYGGETNKWNLVLLCAECHVIYHHAVEDDREDERANKIHEKVWEFMESRYGLLVGSHERRKELLTRFSKDWDDEDDEFKKKFTGKFLSYVRGIQRMWKVVKANYYVDLTAQEQPVMKKENVK